MLARAPGKIILLGEHAVLYGKPGIAGAVDLWSEARAEYSSSSVVKAAGHEADLYADDDFLLPVQTSLRALKEERRLDSFYVEIKSDVPKGLGSSSSSACAAVKAVSELFGVRLSDDELVRYVSLADEVAHGRQSGIDANSVVRGGWLWFKQGRVERIDADPIYVLVVDTGESARTIDAVEKVHNYASSHPGFARMLDDLERATERARSYLERGDLDGLGSAMRDYYTGLKETGISTPRIDEVVYRAVELGLYAKPVGAWMGGSVIVVGEKEKLKELQDKLNAVLVMAGI